MTASLPVTQGLLITHNYIGGGWSVAKGAVDNPLVQPNVKKPPSTFCLSMVAKVGVEMRLLFKSVPSAVKISPPNLNSKGDFHLTFGLQLPLLSSLRQPCFLNCYILDIGIYPISFLDSNHPQM